MPKTQTCGRLCKWLRLNISHDVIASYVQHVHEDNRIRQPDVHNFLRCHPREVATAVQAFFQQIRQKTTSPLAVGQDSENAHP